MKLMNLMMAVAAVGTLASCGGNTEEQEVAEVTFSANTKASVIEWKGAENDEHFHVGTISLSEGSITMKGEELTGGKFVVDMNSIVPTTEGYPAEKLDYLASHLKDTAFFFVSDFPQVTVDVHSYADGKMKATFNLLGAAIEQEVPVKLTQTNDEVSIKGAFKLDVSSAKMPYAQGINEETGKPALKPELEFNIDLKLKK
jgi:polyisoprenoid-binding protein YceI